MSGTAQALLLLIGVYLAVGVVEFVLFVVWVGARRGEAAGAPGPTAEGEAVPGCDCEDCQAEADFALWAKEVAADA